MDGPISTSGRPQLRFDVVSGEVHSSTVRDQSEIKSTGGGGYLHEGTGYVSAPTIESKTIRVQEFWLRTADGKQVPVQWKELNLPVANGQFVHLVHAVAGNGEPRLLAAFNLDSRQFAYLGLSDEQLRYVSVYPARAWSMAIPLVAIGASFQFGFMLALFGIAYAAWRIWPRLTRQRTMAAQIRDRVENAFSRIPAGARGHVEIESVPASVDKIVLA